MKKVDIGNGKLYFKLHDHNIELELHGDFFLTAMDLAKKVQL